MLGLSITAIGMRPFPECWEIWQKLQNSLNLEFLELAIGSVCDVNYDYENIPLILHNSCLYKGRTRHRLDIFDSQTWKIYENFILNNNVLGISIHPPLKRYCDRLELEKALQTLQSSLEIPIYLEIMPSPEYWCSSIETLVTFPLLLDVSHVNIWNQGDSEKTQQICLSLLKSHTIKAIHISHNQGKKDTHDLIPKEAWFNHLISDWSKKYLVTYESLPMDYAVYQRLDKKRINNRSSRVGNAHSTKIGN